jgi:glyoxylase I family protein
MKIKLHHVNFCSTNVPALDAFYRDVLDLQPEPSLEAGRILDKDGYPGRVAFRTDGTPSFTWRRRIWASIFAPVRQ